MSVVPVFGRWKQEQQFRVGHGCILSWRPAWPHESLSLKIIIIIEKEWKGVGVKVWNRVARDS